MSDGHLLPCLLLIYSLLVAHYPLFTFQPRAGVALLNEHIELLTFLSKEGGADLLPSTIDSYTRLNRYEECEKGIKESEKEILTIEGAGHNDLLIRANQIYLETIQKLLHD